MALTANESMNGGRITDLDKRVVVVGSDGAALGSNVPKPDVTGGVYDPVSGATLTPKFKFVNALAATTDSTIVVAVAGKKLRVLAVVFVAGATATAVTFTSKPAGAGAAISATFAAGINDGAALAPSTLGWFETVAGEGLSVTTGAGSTTGIQVVYVEV